MDQQVNSERGEPRPSQTLASQDEALERLTVLALAIGAAQDLPVVYLKLFDFVRQSVPCNWLAVSLVDWEREQRHCVFLAGTEGQLDHSDMPPSPRSNTPPWRAITSGEPVVVNDLAAENFAAQGVAIADEVDPDEPQSLIAVPMIAHGQVLGGFEVQSSQRDAYSDAHVALLQMAGNLAAIATENVQLLESERTQRRAASALASRFRSLVENLDAVVWEADARTHKITFISEHVVKMLGYSVDQWLSEPDFWEEHIFLEERDDVLSKYEAAIAAGEDFETQYRLVGADGQAVWVNDLVHVSQEEGGRRKTLSGVMINITERKRLEWEFLQSQKMESVGRLAGGVAHDFNNLLTAITGYSDMLAMSELSEQQRGDVLEIKKAADRATILTRRLLAFSRRQVLERRAVNLNSLISGFESLVRPIIGEHISIVTLLEPSLGTARLDPAQVEQAILNLIVNARDAMPSGGTLTLETTNARIDKPGGGYEDYAVLLVSDNGVGMDEEVRRHIFEPFFTTKDVDKGTGLGLATVYGITTQMGGHIAVESTPGRGTTFSLFFPRIDEAPDEDALELTAQSLPRGSETILLVEDERGVRELLIKVLSRQGFRVLAASGGMMAIGVAGAHHGRLDLIISDVVMPGMSGPKLVEQLRSGRPELKALLISGFSEEIQQLDAGELRVVGEYLQKPFAPEALVRRVREILDGSSSA